MAECKFDRGIAFDCAAPQQGGVKASIIALNHEDWLNSTVTIDATTKEILTITLASTIQGYEFQVPTAANLIATSEKRDQLTYNHIVQTQVNTIEQLDLNMIAKTRTNKMVYIVKLLEGRARVYGGHVNDPDGTPTPTGVGMLSSQDTDIISDPALGGMTDLIVGTPEGEPGEVQKPYLIAASFDVDTLLTPAS